MTKYAPRNSWTTEKVQELRELVQSKHSIEEIKEYFGISKQRIYQLLQQYGIDTIHCKQARNKITEGCPKKYKIYKRLKNNQNRLNKLGNYLNDATLEDLLPLPTHCPVLGIELEYLEFKGKGHSSYASIDRIDLSKGYDKGNIHIICNRANRIKDNATVEELHLIAKYITNLTK